MDPMGLGNHQPGHPKRWLSLYSSFVFFLQKVTSCDCESHTRLLKTVLHLVATIHLVAKSGQKPHTDFHLIGGFNSIEKYSSNWIISPGIGVKIKNLDFPEIARHIEGLMSTVKFLNLPKTDYCETHVPRICSLISEQK